MQVAKLETARPTFQAMKPNQFKGIDYAVVRKFKAPVEKFNSNSDFLFLFKVCHKAIIKKATINVLINKVLYLC